MPYWAALLLSLLILPAAAQADTVDVIESNLLFNQTEITIHPGDHVRFVNNDGDQHNLHLQDSDDEDSDNDLGFQAPGQIVNIAFPTRGNFLVRCHLHPGMKLTVRVR